jgi:hypothetical protein
MVARGATPLPNRSEAESAGGPAAAGRVAIRWISWLGNY